MSIVDRTGLGLATAVGNQFAQGVNQGRMMMLSAQQIALSKQRQAQLDTQNRLLQARVDEFERNAGLRQRGMEAQVAGQEAALTGRGIANEAAQFNLDQAREMAPHHLAEAERRAARDEVELNWFGQRIENAMRDRENEHRHASDVAALYTQQYGTSMTDELRAALGSATSIGEVAGIGAMAREMHQAQTIAQDGLDRVSAAVSSGAMPEEQAALFQEQLSLAAEARDGEMARNVYDQIDTAIGQHVEWQQTTERRQQRADLYRQLAILDGATPQQMAEIEQIGTAYLAGSRPGANGMTDQEYMGLMQRSMAAERVPDPRDQFITPDRHASLQAEALDERGDMGVIRLNEQLFDSGRLPSLPAGHYASKRRAQMAAGAADTDAIADLDRMVAGGADTLLAIMPAERGEDRTADIARAIASVRAAGPGAERDQALLVEAFKLVGGVDMTAADWSDSDAYNLAFRDNPVLAENHLLTMMLLERLADDEAAAESFMDVDDPPVPTTTQPQGWEQLRGGT